MKYGITRPLLAIALAGTLAGCTMKTEEIGTKTKDDKLTVTYGEEKKKEAAPVPKTPAAQAPVPQTTQPTAMAKQQYETPPALAIDSARRYTALLVTTLGDITIALDAATTPIAVNNFVFLAREKFYDDTIFHRVIKGFMIQGGDPEGTGRGGPGYTFPDELITKEYARGTVAMANRGKDTNGSQFFIMHADYPLPKNYVIFGEVMSGMDVVDAIATAPVVASGSGEASQPATPVTVQTVTITETAPGA